MWDVKLTSISFNFHLIPCQISSKKIILLINTTYNLFHTIYLPGYNQYDQKYGDASSANNAFQYGNYGQYGNNAKDSKYGYVNGGSNVQHEEYHTATKHKIDEEKHEISHKADNKLVRQICWNKYPNW